MSFDSPTPEFDRRKVQIERAFDASDWLKSAVSYLSTKDPLDAIKDVEVLLELMTLRADEILAHAQKLAAERGE
ncbi:MULTISPECIES: hypothetical protein [Pandoraea]|uniref:Uncharacterized protein n=2 Tax=Pandoraea TaxID=93217 RepID=A0A5E4XIJ1_9BURK|nr:MULTISPECIES: hypothetical protein [Pandoraea]VVE18273.1 hypothetical protein PCE31107_03011 [Pandoraea cepalis]VVE36106.1 hypothetical protein PTE31013_03932 [Pandoraea terrigena]